jgi:hypothetical protein
MRRHFEMLATDSGKPISPTIHRCVSSFCIGSNAVPSGDRVMSVYAASWHWLSFEYPVRRHYGIISNTSVRVFVHLPELAQGTHWDGVL